LVLDVLNILQNMNISVFSVPLYLTVLIVYMVLDTETCFQNSTSNFPWWTKDNIWI